MYVRAYACMYACMLFRAVQTQTGCQAVTKRRPTLWFIRRGIERSPRLSSPRRVPRAHPDRCAQQQSPAHTAATWSPRPMRLGHRVTHRVAGLVRRRTEHSICIPVYPTRATLEAKPTLRASPRGQSDRTECAATPEPAPPTGASAPPCPLAGFKTSGG